MREILCRSTSQLLTFFTRYDSFKQRLFARQIRFNENGFFWLKYLVMACELRVEEAANCKYLSEDESFQLDRFFMHIMHSTSKSSVSRILARVDQTRPERFLLLSIVLRNQVNCVLCLATDC